MICIVKSSIESIQNKNTMILRLFATYCNVRVVGIHEIDVKDEDEA